MEGQTFTATTLTGLEEVLVEELKALGAEDIVPMNRAVQFTGTTALMYRANLALRTALRILKPVHMFHARSDNAFYRQIREIDWREYMTLSDTLAVDSVVNSKYFTHSQYVALRVKDAVVDQFRKHTGERPSVDVKNPSLQLNIYINNDECVLSLDSSGDSLHRRGYRLQAGEAPLNEALAAGMILLSGWDGRTSLTDPMCGSGTILIEAALIARNIAPGLLREEFGFLRWPDYDPDLWEAVQTEARNSTVDCEAPILGSDADVEALNMTRQNVVRAGVEDDIKLSLTSFEKRMPSTKRGILIMNPPYGERMQTADIVEFYQRIGDTLKQKYPGHTAWILSGNKEAIKHVGLRTSERYTLYNGPIECKYHKYEIY
ncbi:MAG TPA: THUMP domain-containing protein [bacterium]|nr:THUMP domain-containing protein [bacterium]